MRTGPLLLIFLAAASIYVLPFIAANFQGSHTSELNASGGVNALDCTGCHSNILSELTANAESTRVFQMHSNAAGNTTYTSNFLSPNITNSTNSRVCMLCHLAQVSVTESHTQLVVRPCTDLDCHGSNATTNNTLYPTAGNVGVKLGSTNAHEGWFDALSGITSTRQNETGAYYSKDFYTCLGCHTGTHANINTTEAAYPHDDAGASARRYF